MGGGKGFVYVQVMIRGILNIIIISLVLCPVKATAQKCVTMSELKDMVKSGVARLDEDICVEGICISYYKAQNLETNVNESYTSTPTTANGRTMYIQNPDGSMGMGLHFISSKLTDYPQYSFLSINLKGADLTLNGGIGLSAYGLGEGSVLVSEQRSKEALTVKDKRICELNENDVYTYVRLKDCECVFKDGAYGNIYEKYAVKSSVNSDCKPFGTMDTWSSLLCDSNGDAINMLVNSATPWRRSGIGVQQGVFDVEGIIVKTDLPRYGNENLSTYQIRPLRAEDLDPVSDESRWKTLCSWDWNGNDSDFSPSHGDATLVCTVPGAVTSMAPEANNPAVISHKDHPDKDGLRSNGALSIKASAASWWDWNEDKGNGLYITFSTKNIVADKAYIAFSFSGGKLLDAENSADFPSYWIVEYTLDGITWHKADDRTATMRAMVWKSTKPINGLTYPLSSEVAMGFTEHMFTFPENISGRSSVIVRIVPASKHLSTYSYHHSASRANRPGYTKECFVNFGSIMIRYR